MFTLTHNYACYAMVREAARRVRHGDLDTLCTVRGEGASGWAAGEVETDYHQVSIYRGFLMVAVVCYGQKDIRLENVEPRPLEPDEVRIRVAYGGICGSDIHYYHQGGVGDSAIREPMILGHEVSGEVIEVGADVADLDVGTQAALDPARPCRRCARCWEGRRNLCTDMQFLGSASRMPHVQGGFVDQLVLRADQVIPVADETDMLKLSCAEPLSVALHAVNRLGNMIGARVLVTGSGPIGLLTMAALRYAGATEVVATDIEDAALNVAVNEVGVDGAINVKTDRSALDVYAAGGGYFDFAVEASGAPTALHSLFSVVHGGGKILQLGMLPAGKTPAPVNMLQSREIDLIGSFRANDEFQIAVDLITTGRFDVSPILSGIHAVSDAKKALEIAPDRSQVVKLHLAFG